MASRTGVGEGEDRAFRSSEGARLSAMCATAISAGGKTDAFDLGEEGLDVEDRVILEGSMTGVSKMAELRRPSVIV